MAILAGGHNQNGFINIWQALKACIRLCVHGFTSHLNVSHEYEPIITCITGPHTDTCTHGYMHARMHARTDTCIHRHMHTQTHARTHTHATSKHQHALKKGNSCLSNGFCNKMIKSNRREREGWVDCIFLDCRKAIDTVPHFYAN